MFTKATQLNGSVMSLPNRSLTSNLRHPSIGGLQSQSSQSPILVARINEKKAELENLKQLEDLSAGLAMQMQVLEEKLSNLSDGTEGWCYSLLPALRSILKTL